MKNVRKVMVVILACSLFMVDFVSFSVTLAEEWPDSETGFTLQQTEGEGSIDVALNKWAVIPETASTPVIDGELNDTAWQHSTVLDDFRTVYENQSMEDGPTYRLTYDTHQLYIGGVLSEGDREALARVEVLLSPEGSGTSHYVMAITMDETSRLGATEWNLEVMKTPTVNNERTTITSFSYAMEEDESTGDFKVEVAVPWSAFGTIMPDDGDEWRMNIVHVYNINTRPMASWLPVRTSRYNDAGEAIVVRANVVDEGRMGSLFFGALPQGEKWMPEDVELSYLGFTEKQLSYESLGSGWNHVQLHWKSPNEDWAMLTSVVQSVYEDRSLVTFQHPEPLSDGTYFIQLLAYEDDPADGYAAMLAFDRNSLIAAGLAVEGVHFPKNEPLDEVTYAPVSSEVQALVNLIPEVNGFTGASLPEHPDWSYEISFALSEDGSRLLSLEDGTEYPNALYPESHSLTVRNRLGQPVVYPYYEDNEGREYFFSALKWRLQLDRVLAALPDLTVEDPLGAARLLYALTEKYEGYVPVTSRPFYHYPTAPDSGPPYNYFSSYLGNSVGQETMVVRPLLEAYEVLGKTDVFEQLGQEVNEDVHDRIVQDLFLPALEYSLSFPIAYTNYDPYFWRTLVTVGRVLHRPDYVHLAVEWIERYMTSQFLSDGFWHEITLSYHQQVWNNLNQALNVLQGYSDPPGYISPRDGKSFDNLNLNEQMPILERISALRSQLTYPDRKLLPLQDTWANTKLNSQAALTSLLMPASGIGRFALGEGSDQTQLSIMFTPKYGHDQMDPLNITLYAQGQELLPDLGYTYTRYKQYSKSTMSHNTVVVDSQDMQTNSESRHGGNIGRFVANDSLFQALRANEASAYPGLQTYSREPWLIPFEGGNGTESYVLDLFRVSGGDRHEYTLQGDANRDAVFETELPLTPYGPYLLPPGTVVQEPQDYNDYGSADGHYPGYIYVRDVKQAVLTEDHYTVTLATYDDEGAALAKLNITGLLEDGNNELYLGRSPSIRSTRLYGGGGGGPYDNNVEADKYDLPKLVLRRDGVQDGQLNSTFVTVMEPFEASGHARIDQVTKLQPTMAPAGAVVIRVTYDDVTDIVFSNPLSPDQPIIVDDMTFVGEMGMIRLENGQVSKMELVGGTLLEKGNQSLTGAGMATGTVTGTLRNMDGDAVNALLTDAAVSESYIGRYVIVTHPDQSTSGYQIADIQPIQGKTALILASQDPGFIIHHDQKSEQVYYPLKHWTGTHTFSIANVDVHDEYALEVDGSGGMIAAGTPVTATSSRDGTLFLVPYDTPAVKQEIEAAGMGPAGRTVVMQADQAGLLDTSDLATNVYRVYAIDESDHVLVNDTRIVILDRYTGTLDSNNPALFYQGNWSIWEVATFVGGSLMQTRQTGNFVDIPFYGTQATVIGSRRPNGGEAKIYVDGDYVTTIDTYAPANSHKKELFQTDLLDPGIHVIRFENAGTKQAASTNYNIAFDALNVIAEQQVQLALQGVTEGPVLTGGSISAISSRNGALYLVPAETESTYAAVKAAGLSANGRTVSVTANVYGWLDTTGLAEGVYQVYGADKAGTLTAGSAVIAIIRPDLELIDSAYPGVYYAGDWSIWEVGTFIEGSLMRSRQQGAYVDIPFYGSAATLVGSIRPNGGQANIYVDGVYVTTIDTFHSPNNAHRVELFHTGQLYEGGHMLRVEVAGTKQEASSNYEVSFDALYVYSPVPLIEGVTDGGMYNTPVVVTYGGTVPYTATLNGISLASGATVNAEGAYELIVQDEAVNETRLTFVIDQTAPTVTGVTYNGLYTGTVQIIFQDASGAAALLDGLPIDSGHVVSAEGEYELVVTDGAGNQTILPFLVASFQELIHSMSDQVDAYVVSQDLSPVFASQLSYRLSIIEILLNQGQHITAKAYLQDFVNVIHDPSVQAQQLISGAAAAQLSAWASVILGSE